MILLSTLWYIHTGGDSWLVCRFYIIHSSSKHNKLFSQHCLTFLSKHTRNLSVCLFPPKTGSRHTSSDEHLKQTARLLKKDDWITLRNGWKGTDQAQYSFNVSVAGMPVTANCRELKPSAALSWYERLPRPLMLHGDLKAAGWIRNKKSHDDVTNRAAPKCFSKWTVQTRVFLRAWLHVAGSNQSSGWMRTFSFVFRVFLPFGVK